MYTWTAFGSTIAMTIKQPLLYENDNDDENLFLQFMPTPPGRFCIRLQEYAKGGWQVFFSAAATFS